MAQHDSAAVDVPRSLSMDDAAAAFDDLDALDSEDDPEIPEDDIPEGEADTEEGDEPETDDADDEDEEEGEPEPAIAPPASLTAEEKADWAQLPPEAQQKIVAIEARRTTEVQKGLEQARNAQRESESAAAGRIAEAERLHAEQLAAIAKAYAPQPPDPRLAETNPQAWIAQKARYDAAAAQHGEFMQQVTALHDAAAKESERLQAESLQTQWKQVRDDLPEAADATQWQALMGKLTPLAIELGYPKELLADATPVDIRAIKRASEWKDKAAKYDALMSRKMAGVRQHKGKSAKPNAAQPVGSGRARASAKAMAHLKATGSDSAAIALFDAIL